MQDLFDIVTTPLKKLVALIFSLSIGNTNLGSIIVIGFIFVVMISVITHMSGSPHIGSIGRFISSERRNRS